MLWESVINILGPFLCNKYDYVHQKHMVNIIMLCLPGSTRVIIALLFGQMGVSSLGQMGVSSLVNCSNGAHGACQTCYKAFIH